MGSQQSGLSRRQYAKRRGVSESVIRRHIASGLLAPAVRADDTLDVAKADELLTQNLIRRKAPPAALRTAMTRRLRAKVAILRDEVNEMAGSYVPAADVRALVMSDLQVVANHLRCLVDAAPHVAGKPAPEALRILKDAVNDILTDVSQTPAPEEPTNV